MSTPGAVRCLARDDALIDAWTRAASRDRKGLLYEALWLKIVTPRDAAAAAARMRRIPDRRILDSILADFLDGSHSPGEVMARREVFNRPCDRVLERQVEIWAAGRRRNPDLLHRAAKVIVECDSDRDHTGPKAVARDNERRAELATAGYVTLHFMFRDLRDRPEWCRTMLDRTIASRTGTGAAGA